MTPTPSPSATLIRRALLAATPGIATGTLVAQAQDTEEVVNLPSFNVAERPFPAPTSPKFTQPLVDTPQTITVIPRTLIEEQGATNLRDILRNSPGITFQAGEGGTPAGDQMSIRGFSARTDMFVDGVRDLGGYARDSFNLEQVEVAKGPSSAVAGRGSTGGSINLVTKRPQSKAFAAGSLAAGTDDYARATIDVNQPLDGTTAAFRLNAMWNDADVPGRDVVHNSGWGVAPSLALGLGTQNRATLSYQRLEQENVPDYGLPRQVLDYDPPVPFTNFYGLKRRDYERIDQDLVTLDLAHHFGNGFTIRNLTRYGRTYRDSVITAPRFVSGSTTVIRRSDWKSRDQNDDVVANVTSLTGEFATGKVLHSLSAGLEFTRESERNYNRVENPSTVLPDTDVYAPDPGDPYDGHITRDGAFTDGRGDTNAAYLFDTLHLGEHWQVNAGVRYDDFDAKQDVVDASGGETSYQRRDREFSTRLGVVYKPTQQSSLYAGFANSFNPSAEGLSLTTRGGSLETVAPEKTRTYELGAKWNTAGNRLSLASALFRTEKTNARTPGIDPNDPPQVLEGRERVDGVEFSVAGKITEDWDVFAGLSLMRSEILASNAGNTGGELGLTPERSFNAWTTYRLPHGFTIGGGAQNLASVVRSATATDTVPAYWIASAMAACEVNEHLTLRLNVTNLTDEEYIDRVGGGHHIPGQARQATLTASFNF